MNKYWIHKNTGTKAIIYHIDAPDSPFSYLILHADNTKSCCTRQCLDTYWIPITKAEYESSLTLNEIKRSRNITVDNKGMVAHVKQYIYDSIMYKLGDLFITKAPCKVKHPDSTIPKNTLCYIYQILKNTSGNITLYLRSIPSLEHTFEDVIVTTPTDLPDILSEIKIDITNKEDKIEDRLKEEEDSQFVKQYNATKKELELMKDKDTFESICQDMIATHNAKNHDYGDSFHNLFKELGINYAYGHLREKLERIKTLKDNEAKVKGESMIDSLKDLANYAIMTIIELQDDKKN